MRIKSAVQDMKLEGHKWSLAISSSPVANDIASTVTGRRSLGIKADVGNNIMPRK